MKIGLVLGSSRNEGNTFLLAQSINKRQALDIFNLNDYQISAYDYQHFNRDDDFCSLVENLIQYEHIIFATPVYWYSMSAQMKMFFDRLTDLLTIKKDLGRQLKNKHCSLIATGTDPESPKCFEQAFQLSFNYLHMIDRGFLYIQCEEKFDENKARELIDDFLKMSLLS